MKFPKLENFAKNKLPKFEIKNVLLRHTWARILKSYCHISNQQPQISQIEKFYENAKMRKVGTKMPFLGIFSPNFEKNYCHVLNQHLQICQIAKFFEEMKILIFWTKMGYFSIFRLQFLKTIAIFQTTTLKFV